MFLTEHSDQLISISLGLYLAYLGWKFQKSPPERKLGDPVESDQARMNRFRGMFLAGSGIAFFGIVWIIIDLT